MEEAESPAAVSGDAQAAASLAPEGQEAMAQTCTTIFTNQTPEDIQRIDTADSVLGQTTNSMMAHSFVRHAMDGSIHGIEEVPGDAEGEAADAGGPAAGEPAKQPTAEEERAPTRGSLPGADRDWVEGVLNELGRNLYLSPREGNSSSASAFDAGAEPACGLRREEMLGTADLKQAEAARQHRGAVPVLDMGEVYPADSDDEYLRTGSAGPAGEHEAGRHEAVPLLNLSSVVVEEESGASQHLSHEFSQELAKNSLSKNSVSLPAISKVSPEEIAAWTEKFLRHNPSGPPPPKQKLAYGKPGHSPFGELQTSTMRKENPGEGMNHLPAWADPRRRPRRYSDGVRKDSRSGVKLPPVAEQLRASTTKLLRQAAKARMGSKGSAVASGEQGAPGVDGNEDETHLTQHFHCHFHVLPAPPEGEDGAYEAEDVPWDEN